MTTLQELYLDISRETSYKTIYAKQYDEASRYLKIHVMDKGRPVEINEGSAIKFNMRRSDEEPGSSDGTLEDDGTITVLLPAWMLQVAGECICNVSITEGTEKLSTLNFTTIVEEAPSDGSVIVTAEAVTYSASTVTREEIDELQALVEDLRERLSAAEADIAALKEQITA